MNINRLPDRRMLDVLSSRMATQFQLPAVYDDALSYQGLIYKLMQYIQDTIQNVSDWNDWLEDFVSTFDTKLQNTVRDKIQELYGTGELAELVAQVIDVIQDQIDSVDSRIDTEIGIVNSSVDAKINDVDNRLSTKLAQTKNEVSEIDGRLSTRLAQKAGQEEVNTISGQINNLIANAGNTDGNAELLDIRVGWDGVVYPTAGDAVRSIQQFITEENEIWSVI